MSKKFSQLVGEQLREQIGTQITNYLNIPNDKRQELEKNGINLSNFIYEAIIPYIQNSKINKLLIVMEEGIGNMVMLTPAIKALKHFNPRLHITIWGKESSLAIIKGWNLVDNMISEFDYGMYDLCFFSIWSASTKQKYGEVLQNHCKAFIDTKLKTHHESIQHLTISDFLDGDSQMCSPHCQVKENKNIDAFYKDIKLNKQKVIIFGDTTLKNIGWDRKKWPYYVELASLINKKLSDYRIVLIGDKEDAAIANEKEWPTNVNKDFIGKIDIQELAYLIKGCDIYIGNDTGPTHIAAALGIATYAIFGPTLISKNMPIGQNVHIIHKALACAPCQYTERWEECDDPCSAYYNANELYNKIFFPEGQKEKYRVMLVGDFSEGIALRNEIYIKKTLEKEFGYKVLQFDYRVAQKKAENNLFDATFNLVNTALQKRPDHILICGGQGIIPQVLNYINFFLPKTKISIWYVDNRGEIEPWFRELSSVCHNTYWSTGDPILLSQIFGQTQKPCEFLPIVPDDTMYKPIECEKDIDVLFVGTPHSEDRIKLLEHLTANLPNVNIQIYGNGNWPDTLKQYVNNGVFNNDFNKLLNRAKIVVNQNILNNVPLYFSDRYFYPMAVKSVGLNKYVPRLEDMFEDNKHMIFWNTFEECVIAINQILQDEKLQAKIQEEGYKLYKEKYTLKNMLKKVDW